MKRLYLTLSLFSFLSCSTRPIENFFTDLAGSYTINAAGALFLLRVFPTLGITNASTIVSDNAGRFTYTNTTTSVGTALFSVEGTPRTSRSGVFKVEGQNLYFGVGLISLSNLTFSSNLVSSPDKAEFFFLIPVANKR